MSLYSYRTSAPKAYKNGFLFIGDVIHLNSNLSFLIWVRKIPIHTFCLYSKIELSSLSPCYFTDYHNMLNSRCQDLSVLEYIDQSEDPVLFFKMTWMVIYFKKAGRLVLAVPCKFPCHAIAWTTDSLSLPGWKGIVIPSCYILIYML